jgi:hypothetical protein
MIRETPRSPTAPDPGYYLVRLVPRGWAVACEITLDDDGYRCRIDGGEAQGPWTSDDLRVHWANWLTAEAESPIIKILTHGRRCQRSEYDYRLAMKAWALKHSPEHPAARPDRSIDVRLLEADDF